MSYAVCCVSIAPVRSEPNHKSEMGSQLLFGECAIITNIHINGWVRIVCKNDAYAGWCQQAHLQEIDENHYYLDQQDYTADWVSELEYNGHLMWVPMGSSLTALRNGKAFWRRNTLHFSGKVWNPTAAKKDVKTIKQLAFKFLNTTYLWGGRSVFGMDCSGFTQSIYKFLDVSLLRNADQQATQGETIYALQHAHCGDLAFFDDENGEIIHVGMLLSNHEVIHATGKVRVDKIDSGGIINAETGLRTQKLKLIKRYL